MQDGVYLLFRKINVRKDTIIEQNRSFRAHSLTNLYTKAHLLLLLTSINTLKKFIIPIWLSLNIEEISKDLKEK